MHPFYGPSARLMGQRDSASAGLLSMAAYLAFWAVVVGITWRALDERLPAGPLRPNRPDPALALLRERYARGEIDRTQFVRMRLDLEGP